MGDSLEELLCDSKSASGEEAPAAMNVFCIFLKAYFASHYEWESKEFVDSLPEREYSIVDCVDYTGV